jgi:hypothetical protein
MECILVFFALVALLGGLAVFGLGRAPGRRDLQASYRALAQRFHGICSGTGWFSMPRVSFPYRSVQVTVEALAQAPQDLGRGPAVRVHLPWPGAALQAEIRYPARPPQALPHDHWETLLPPAARGVEPRYSLRGTDPRATAEVFNEVVLWHVEQLRTRPSVSPLCIQLGWGAMTVAKVMAIQHGPDLIRFVETALDLYDQALLTRTRGITFVQQQSAQVLEQVVCRICGEEIREGLVFCRRCKTPHHRDCWQYAGRCSVFACGETEFRTPQVAERLPGADTWARRSSD